MSVILKSKTRVLGDGINCSELLEAISNPMFKDNAPVQVRCDQYIGWLKMIYRCQNCSRLHFAIGELDSAQHLEAVVHHQIYADHYSDGNVVTKKELVSILLDTPESTEIILESSIYSIGYKLTLVYKCCDECPCVHLDCYYEKDAIIPN